MNRSDLRILLVQVRDADDPMRPQEITTFADALDIAEYQLTPWDLLGGIPAAEFLDGHHGVLIGGSGDYSAADDADWLETAFRFLRQLHADFVPTFGSCWGFQALGRALGGTTIRDPERAELGALPISPTAAARDDVCFSGLSDPFIAFQGHQDRVSELPPGATLLASTELVPIQAFCYPDRLMYATQFHPELTRRRFLERLANYPSYIQEITGLSYHEFESKCAEAPEPGQLLHRWLDQVLICATTN